MWTRFHFSGKIIRREIAGSYGKCVFNFIKITAKLSFQNDSTILYSHQQSMRDPVSPHLCQHLVCSLFFIFAIHDGISSWFSLPFPNGYPYNLFSEIIVQLLCPFFSLSIYWGFFFFFLLNFECSLYILDTRPLSDIWLVNILSVCHLSFHILNIVFQAWNFLFFWWTAICHLLNFTDHAYGISCLKTLYLILGHDIFTWFLPEVL